MPRTAIGDRPLTAAERQARRREVRQRQQDETQRAVSVLRVALTKISDRTSERMRTKAAMEQALDAIGALAADALATLN